MDYENDPLYIEAVKQREFILKHKLHGAYLYRYILRLIERMEGNGPFPLLDRANEEHMVELSREEIERKEKLLAQLEESNNG